MRIFMQTRGAQEGLKKNARKQGQIKWPFIYSISSTINSQLPLNYCVNVNELPNPYLNLLTQKK